MARGWESKSIESQQDDAARRKALKPALTPAERARVQQREALALTRARLAAELDGATAFAHRRMLESALADIDVQMELLG